MAGGLMQLVAYGSQDIYLTANPKVTFFQAVYKRHSNFASEVIEQTVNGTAADNGRVSITIARNGDLVQDMYLEMKAKSGLSTSTKGASAIFAAERAVKDIEISIGGQRIDRHFQKWWRLYDNLYHGEAKKTDYAKMTSNSQNGAIYLPLIFWFNRHPGLSLPLIASAVPRGARRRGPQLRVLPLHRRHHVQVLGQLPLPRHRRAPPLRPKERTSTSSNKSNTPAPTPSRPATRSKCASPSTTRSRNSSSVSTTAPISNAAMWNFTSNLLEDGVVLESDPLLAAQARELQRVRPGQSYGTGAPLLADRQRIHQLHGLRRWRGRRHALPSVRSKSSSSSSTAKTA
jgi:hypothetical protein